MNILIEQEKTMNKLIYEGFETENLAAELENSSVKRLIQELNFKYGLKVVDKVDAYVLSRNNPVSFLLANPSGFMVAKVWTDKEDGHDVYNYRSPFYRKDRGSDSADRETVHSKKLSTLMATLKRNNVVPPPDGILNKYPADSFNQGIGMMDSHHGRDYKNSNFSADEIHEMLKTILLRESPNELDINKCKETLDKWNEQDRIKVRKHEDIKRFFNNEFYAVGADKLNHLVIGSVKRMPRQGTEHYSFEVVKPFKRMMELPDELKAIMLMNKVHAEGKNVTKFYANTIPADNGYNPDLDLINVSARHVDEFNCQWTLVPCSGL
jgi:hypothetical protein